MPFLLKKYYPLRNVFFFFGEGILIFLAVTVVQVFLASFEFEFFCPPEFVLRSALVTFIFQLSLYFFDLYDLGVASSFSDTAARITQAFGVGCIILAAFYYFFPRTIISTETFWAGYLAICCCITIYRSSYLFALRNHLFTQPVVLFGAGQLAEKIHREISNRMDAGFRIVAYVTTGNIGFDIPEHSPSSSEAKNLPSLVKQFKAERIIVALEERRGGTPIKELITCRLNGAIVSDGVDFYEKLTGKISVENAKPDWIIYSVGFNKSRIGSFCKRCIDIILALLGLLISSPIAILIGIIIKLASKGPVFYRQERVGENNRLFQVIKFRSMHQDAEKDGAVWAAVNDNRVTGFGKFIRNVRIDEIPQMWNILLGDMSFVGPRPERSVFVKQLEKNIPYYAIRHAIKPGLTGWAQICYPYGASEKDALCKLEYDLYYLKNMSLTLDFWIIFQTVKTVLFKKGAR